MPAVHTVLDAESAHRLAILTLKYRFPPMIGSSSRRKITDPQINQFLSIDCFGLPFDNVIGLAAGFDKDADAVSGLNRLGFGFIEIGSVTPKPQAGNEKPRVFRYFPCF